MPKLTPTRHFIKSFEDLLTGKLTAREVLIYGIVAQFEANNTPCFISRAELAKRINESEATAERALQVLIAEGYIKASREGRKRYLSTAYPQKPDLYQPDTNQPADLYQKKGQSVSKEGLNLYQLDTLTRSITRSNITRSINQTNISTNSSHRYINLWDDEKQSMIRKRIPV